MQKHYRRVDRWRSRVVVPAALLVAIAATAPFCADAAQGAERAPAKPNVIGDLLADGPAPGLAPELKLFGQFVGDWNLRAETYREGRTVRNEGRLHIGWILYGTALQDIWTSDAPDPRPGYPQKSFGTTLRFYDDKAKIWRIVWIAPTANIVQTFTARETGGEIVLEGRTVDGTKRERWIWSNYTPSSFDWRSVESADDGKTWKITQRMWAARMPARRGEEAQTKVSARGSSNRP
jgi:hypothetical protein